jgi:hypothetical protein
MNINEKQIILLGELKEWLENHPIGTEWKFSNDLIGNREFFLELVEGIQAKGEYGSIERHWLKSITSVWKRR